MSRREASQFSLEFYSADLRFTWILAVINKEFHSCALLIGFVPFKKISLRAPNTLVTAHYSSSDLSFSHSPTRSLARSLARWFVPVYLRLAYRARFLLNLRGRSIYTSAQFREAASRECGFIGPLHGGKSRAIRVHVNVKRGRMGRRASLLWGCAR